MIAALQPAFDTNGLTLRVLDWEAPLAQFDEVDLVMLGTAWNYQDKPADFHAKLETLAGRGIAVCNPPDMVRWNMTKTYLRELEERGAVTVPTLWQRDVARGELLEAFEYFDCEKLVVKRQVGAGALDQVLIDISDMPPVEWRYGHRAMLQPYLSGIEKKGELSFIFIDGELSHALQKLPAPGDYRIQSLYGGKETPLVPTIGQTAQAQAIVDALPFDAPLYARIDMLESDAGALMVMEAELIEPYLYPEQGAQLGHRLASAIIKRIS